MQLIDEPTLTMFRKAATSRTCQLADFETTAVRPGFGPNALFLIVSGTVPAPTCASS
jgi:hypothetical protein